MYVTVEGGTNLRIQLKNAVVLLETVFVRVCVFDNTIFP